MPTRNRDTTSPALEDMILEHGTVIRAIGKARTEACVNGGMNPNAAASVWIEALFLELARCLDDRHGQSRGRQHLFRMVQSHLRPKKTL